MTKITSPRTAPGSSKAAKDAIAAAAVKPTSAAAKLRQARKTANAAVAAGVSPSEAVMEALAETDAVPAKAPATKKAAPRRGSLAGKGVKAAAPKATTVKNTTGARRGRALPIVDGPTQTCTGPCGETKSVKGFPNLGGGKRGAECRSCREERLSKLPADKRVRGGVRKGSGSSKSRKATGEAVSPETAAKIGSVNARLAESKSLSEWKKAVVKWERDGKKGRKPVAPKTPLLDEFEGAAKAS